MATLTLAPQVEVKGYDTRRLRLETGLTRSRVAALASVPLEHVGLLEKGLPVPLDSKRRVLAVLWARKAGK